MLRILAIVAMLLAIAATTYVSITASDAYTGVPNAVEQESFCPTWPQKAC